MRHQRSFHNKGILILMIVLINAIALEQGYTGNQKWYFVLIVTVPLLILALLDADKGKPAISSETRRARFLKHYGHSGYRRENHWKSKTLKSLNNDSITTKSAHHEKIK